VVNPHLAQCNPMEAISALKRQFKAYLDGVEPFIRKRRRNESMREYWCRFLNDDDSDVLAVCQRSLFEYGIGPYFLI